MAFWKENNIVLKKRRMKNGAWLVTGKYPDKPVHVNSGFLPSQVHADLWIEHIKSADFVTED